MLFLDLETFNGSKDISAGTYAYAETAEILLVAYAHHEEPVRLWDLTTGAAAPVDLLDALRDPRTLICAHNAQFDRAILREVLTPLLGVPGHAADPARWTCTMVKAMTHGFPRSLDQLGRILGLPADAAKIGEGKKLIHRFCKPAPSNHKAQRYDRHSRPEEWARFCDYARRDIDAMRAIDARLPDWNFRDAETALYRLDQRINDRGVLIDGELVAAGAAAADAEKDRMADLTARLTNGAVPRPTMREAMRLYLNDTFELDLPNSQAATLRQLLAERSETLPTDARALIGAALSANKTSTAKYKALAPAVSRDGRFRGGLQFAGAARTRRWSGRGLQLQNLPSRGLPPQRETDQYIRALKTDCHDLLFGDLMLYGSAALRGVAIAPAGRKLVVADLSNIEGRGLAWLAGEQWKLDAFAAFDRGEGPDLYNVTAGSLLGKAPDAVSKDERNGFGKVPELALGYAAGVGGLQTFARAYGVRMAEQWDNITTSMGAFVGQAQGNYESWGRERDPDLAAEEWIASETVKLAWRDRHPATEALWRACETAFRDAIRHPGIVQPAGPHLKFKCVTYAGHRYVLNRLPSGNFLVYFDPRVERDGSLSYMGLNQITRQWSRLTTYGGKLAENATQSVARDVMAAAMPAIEAADYAIVFTVHDEIATETPDTAEFSADGLAALMAKVPPWATGFPLAAAGFECTRYRK